MPINRLGTDIIEIARIQRAIERWGDIFLKRVYTEAELGQYLQKLPSLAARFAAKEAVVKAIGTSDHGISWQDIEILADTNGQPQVNLYGRARNEAEAQDIASLAISLAHSREYAIAFVIGEASG